MWVCFLITILTFSVLRLTQSKTGWIWLLQWVKRFLNLNTCYMISYVTGSLWDWCHLNSISIVFKVTFSYFNIWGFWWIFVISEFFVFEYRSQNENLQITENLVFASTKLKWIWIYFLITFLTFLAAKREINKSKLNLINLDGLEALKEISTWYLTENMAESFWDWYYLKSISTASEATFSYSILWRFCSTSLISEKSEITENLYFWIYSVQLHVNLFSISISIFLVLKLK